MAVIAIITMEAQPGLDAVLEQNYPGKYRRWSPTLVVVTTLETPAEVSAKIGVKSRNLDGTLTGQFGDIFVVQLSPAYGGFGPTAFWEWLKSAFEVTG